MNLTLFNVQRQENFVLSWLWWFSFGISLVNNEWWIASVSTIDFSLESKCSSLYWHTCAMEGEWEENIFAELFLISD